MNQYQSNFYASVELITWIIYSFFVVVVVPQFSGKRWSIQFCNSPAKIHTITHIFLNHVGPKSCCTQTGKRSFDKLRTWRQRERHPERPVWNDLKVNTWLDKRMRGLRGGELADWLWPLLKGEAQIIWRGKKLKIILNKEEKRRKKWNAVHPRDLQIRLFTDNRGRPRVTSTQKSNFSQPDTQLIWWQIYLQSVLTLPSINTPSWRFIHGILSKLTIALNLSGPVTAACPQTERLLCNIYQGLLPFERGFITELHIYKTRRKN